MRLSHRRDSALKIIALLVLAAVCLWMQPWATATATPQFPQAQSRALDSASRCPAGYRKSTITARCVRNGFRFPTFGWL